MLHCSLPSTNTCCRSAFSLKKWLPRDEQRGLKTRSHHLVPCHQLLFACRDPAEYLNVLNVNVVGPLRVTQALLPSLLKKDTRKVINISSTMGSISTHRWAFSAWLVDQCALTIAHGRPCDWLPTSSLGLPLLYSMKLFVFKSQAASLPYRCCCSSGAENNASCLAALLLQLCSGQAAACTVLHD